MIPGIGGVEYLVIATLIIIFVGPKDLPGVLRTLGKWWGKIRSISREFKSSINSIANEAGIDDIKKDIEDVSSKSFTDEMRDSINQSILDDEKSDEKKD
tara:strand:+ start:319 stop:615 length:297 start_codon:yes stop_codon:yes gene_type:complete